MNKMSEEEIAASAAKAVNCLTDQVRAALAGGLFDKRVEECTRRMVAEYFLNKAAERTGRTAVSIAALTLCDDQMRAEFMELVEDSLKDVKKDLFKAAGMTKPENQ